MQREYRNRILSREEVVEELNKQGLMLIESCKCCDFYLNEETGAITMGCDYQDRYRKNMEEARRNRRHQIMLPCCPYEGTNCFVIKKDRK